jgi:hypothetical protein
MFRTRVVEEIKTHFMFNNLFFSEIRAVNEIMRKNSVDNWTTKAADTHSE